MLKLHILLFLCPGRLLLFLLFHFPCSTTCITIYKETRSLKWTAAAWCLPTGIGILLCVSVHVLSRCVQYLFGLKVSKIYQVLFIIVVVVGAVASLDVVWDIADTFNGLMAIPNFIALFALSGVVAKLTKEYFFDKNKLAK